MADDLDWARYSAILSQQKATLKRALAHKGKKPPDASRRSRQELKQEFEMAALNSNMTSSMGPRNQIRSCFIGAAYTPCTVPPFDSRADIASMPSRMRSVTSIRLAIYNLPPTADAGAVLAKGAVVAIKKPYCKRTADGGLFVRVDHPSDFVRLRPGNSIIPKSLATHTTGAGPSVLRLKEDGNAAFKKGNFETAVDLYSHALENMGDVDDNLQRDLWRNRSAAYLRLGRCELAIADALASMVRTKRESTSEAALELDNNHLLGSRDEKEAGAREADRESSTGIWLRASYANHSCIPNATRAFVGDMMIVRATRDIPAGGEILMGYAGLDKPFAERQKKLKASYGFECDCELRRAEAEVSSATAKTRARLRKEIRSFLSANPLRANMSDRLAPSKKAKVQRLLREMQETCPNPHFERLPRPLCDEIGLLAAIIQGGRVIVARRVAIQGNEAIVAARYASQCLVEIGNKGAALALEVLSKEIYTCISGAEDGFMDDFGWVS
ncbi:hypothetical protein PpBr36_04920 [Pyricularia pennisetigena]|uniref:hypothetical protein n=1 Tax=Pyricularia pennisetigena TaxID=1578925 RepID=UPI00114E8663|nr:hypothetical protein PpBr36_04920 [Pyricularia pennisetigena]TLS27253.1 hypothetical protein PpBr36_04920 [Pyricularia pennisetigena]